MVSHFSIEREQNKTERYLYFARLQTIINPYFVIFDNSSGLTVVEVHTLQTIEGLLLKLGSVCCERRKLGSELTKIKPADKKETVTFNI